MGLLNRLMLFVPWLVICCVVPVPSAVIQNLVVQTASADWAQITWQWKKIWMEEQGQIDEVKGEFIGFRVQVLTLSMIIPLV